MAARFNNKFSTSQEAIVNLSERRPSVLESPMATWCLGQAASQKRKVTFCLLIVSFLAVIAMTVIILKAKDRDPNFQFTYPYVQRDSSSVYLYHGLKMEDPYRWLEQNSTPQTSKFIVDQNRLTNSFLDASSKIPREKRIVMTKKLNDINAAQWMYDVPEKIGSTYFRRELRVLGNSSYQITMYVQDDLDGPRRVLLDENDDPEIAESMSNIAEFAYASKGQLMAYSLTPIEGVGESPQNGDGPNKNFNKIVILNTTTSDKLPDLLVFDEKEKIKLIQFSSDDQGLLYLLQDPPSSESMEDQNDGNDKKLGGQFRVFLHPLGTHQKTDIVVGIGSLEPDSTNYQFSDDGAYLFLRRRPKDGSNRTILVLPLDLTGVKNLEQIQPPKLLLEFQAIHMHVDYTYIANQGPKLFFTTALHTNLTVISVDYTSSSSPGENHKESPFVKENRTETLIFAVATDGDKLFLVYQSDSKLILEWRRLLDGSLIQKYVDLPHGLIRDLGSHRLSNEILLHHVNLVSSTSTYQCVLQKDFTVNCKLIQQPKIAGLDLTTFVHKEIFYADSTGTSMPIHLLHKKDLIPGKSYPMLLEQGAFMRAFKGRQIFVDNFEGIYAIAKPRDVPYLRNKPNGTIPMKKFEHQTLVDDFGSAVDFLIKNNYTSPHQLAIMGGWEVAALINQRPGLCAAAVIPVGGKLDLLRHREHCRETNNDDHCNQLGGPEEEENFGKLLTYSPLHNIHPSKNHTIQYPAILVNTWIKSKWSFPAQAFKYVAQLQYTIGKSGQQTNPLLLRVDTTSVDNIWYHLNEDHIKSMADMYVFLAETLGLDFKIGSWKN